MWIDLNNDGILDNNSELLLSDNADSTTGTIQIPSIASLNTPLRLRIMSISFSGNLDPVQTQFMDKLKITRYI